MSLNKTKYNRRSFITKAAVSASVTAAAVAVPNFLLARPLEDKNVAAAQDDGRMTLGMVIFEGFELLDVFGPLEMLGSMHLRKKVQILLIAEKGGPVKSSAGPSVMVDHTFAEVPKLDIVMIPGGMGTRREVDNENFINEFKQMAQAASRVASICTGAAVLARTGLLDGRRATTNKMAFQWATSQGPNVKWVKKARWIEDGKFFTSSGVSAGIDMALAFIERMFGPELARKIAQGAEYEWNEDPHHDPFARLSGLIP